MKKTLAFVSALAAEGLAFLAARLWLEWTTVRNAWAAYADEVDRRSYFRSLPPNTGPVH